MGSFWRFASHPSAGFWLQSVQPGSHDPMVHIPCVHAAVSWGPTHTDPHAPQFRGSLPATSTSQPSLGWPLQSAHPDSHAPILQRPATHAAPAFGNEQTVPQVAQFDGSVSGSVQSPAHTILPFGHPDPPAPPLPPPLPPPLVAPPKPPPPPLVLETEAACDATLVLPPAPPVAPDI